MTEAERPKRHRGIYLLPNLFTTATLFGGFYAIVAAIQGRFSDACVGVFAAMIADALDGRVARLTNTQSDFGKEYDSLADMVTFGLASALVVYIFSLHSLEDYVWLGGKLGWLVAFVYTAAAALRLARFNVHVELDGEKGFFFGLPSPSAAAVTVGFVWAADDFGLAGDAVVFPAMLVTLGAALLMVSNIRYSSFKDLNLSERVPFVYILAMVCVFVLIALDPPRVAFLTFFFYALSGPVLALRRRSQKRAEDSHLDSSDN